MLLPALLCGALSSVAARVEGAPAFADLGPIPHQDSPSRFHARATVLSPDGRHVARVVYETETGTFFVTIDGRRVASGYDEIAHFSSGGPGVGGEIALSRDGSRFAFVGRRNDRVFLVVDGDRVEVEPARFNDVGQFLFSADGRHYACAILAEGRSPGGVHPGHQLVYDGEILSDGPTVSELQASRSGSTLAWVEIGREGSRAVVNGRKYERHELVEQLQLDDDGTVHAYAVRKTVGDLERDWQVIKNGTPLPPVFSGRPQLTVHPRGRVGAFASTGRDGRGRDVRVAVDGRPDPVPYQYVERFGFSASGDGYAYAARPGSRPSSVLVPVANGEISDFELDTVTAGPFFGDSPRSVAFHGMKRDVRPDVLWVSGKTYETARLEKVLVGNGSGFLYRTREERNRAKVRFWDGRSGPELDDVDGSSMTLSRSGRGAAYEAETEAGDRIVVHHDGTRVNRWTVRPNHFSRQYDAYPDLLLSADGQRLAFAVGDRRRIHVNGTPITGEYLWFELPSFSPDGEHFAAAGWDGERWDVLLDGRVVLSARHVFSDAPATLAFRDGALEALVVRGGRFERHAIPLSGDGVTPRMAPETEAPAPIATAAPAPPSPRTGTDASPRATEHRPTTTEESSRQRADREGAELREGTAEEEEADLRERALEEAREATERITDTSKKVGRFFRKKTKQVRAGARGFKEGFQNAADGDDPEDEDEGEGTEPPPSAPTSARSAGENPEASGGATPRTAGSGSSTETRRSSKPEASGRAAGAATPGAVSETAASELPPRLQRHVASGVLSPSQLEVEARCEERSGSWLHDCGCIAGKPYVEAVWSNASDTSPPESSAARASERHWSHRSSSSGRLGRRLQVACETGGWGVGTRKELRLQVDLLEALGVPYNLERNNMGGRTAIPRMSPCELLDVLRAADFDAMAVALRTDSYLRSIEKETVCRDRESIQAEAERDCSKMPLDIDCECYIEEYTEFWMSERTSFSSRSLSSARSKAMQRCTY